MKFLWILSWKEQFCLITTTCRAGGRPRQPPTHSPSSRARHPSPPTPTCLFNGLFGLRRLRRLLLLSAAGLLPILTQCLGTQNQNPTVSRPPPRGSHHPTRSPHAVPARRGCCPSPCPPPASSSASASSSCWPPWAPGRRRRALHTPAGSPGFGGDEGVGWGGIEKKTEQHTRPESCRSRPAAPRSRPKWRSINRGPNR